jgi:hypothetical protein
MDGNHAACDGLWVRDLLATAGPFVLLVALLLDLAHLVLDPTPPRHVVLATGPARSDVDEAAREYPPLWPVGLAAPGPERGQRPACRHQWSAVPKPRQCGLEVQTLAWQGIGWIPPGLIVGIRATNSDESTTGVGRRRACVGSISLP